MLDRRCTRVIASRRAQLGTLITNTVAPEQVPAMCSDIPTAPSVSDSAVAPAESPAADAPVEQAPAETPAQ